MKNTKSTLLGIAGIISVGMAAPSARAGVEVQLQGARVGNWTMDYEAALDLAAEKKLPILLNFTGSDWCGWCKMMDGQVFSQDEWRMFAAENVILITLDFPKDKSIVPGNYVERNEMLKNQYKVGGFPTYIVLTDDGKTEIGKLGAAPGVTPASFIKQFQRVLKMSESGIAQYIKDNPDKAEAYKAALDGYKKALEELETWLKTKPERNDENTQKFEEFQKGITDAETKLDEF